MPLPKGTIPRKPSAPKVASAKTFSGVTPALAKASVVDHNSIDDSLSLSHHYLMNEGCHPESEYEGDE